MKKKFIKILLSAVIMFNLAVVKASDSASNSGYGCTLNGSIYDSFISASVTGTSSSNYNISLTNAYYYNTAGKRKKAVDKSSMTYINYFGSSVSTEFWKWNQVNVQAANSNTGYTISIRTLIN